MAQYSFAQDAADYPVQDIRGIDLGASGGSDGSEIDPRRDKERI